MFSKKNSRFKQFNKLKPKCLLKPKDELPVVKTNEETTIVPETCVDSVEKEKESDIIDHCLDVDTAETNVGESEKLESCVLETSVTTQIEENDMNTKLQEENENIEPLQVEVTESDTNMSNTAVPSPPSEAESNLNFMMKSSPNNHTQSCKLSLDRNISSSGFQPNFPKTGNNETQNFINSTQKTLPVVPNSLDSLTNNVQCRPQKEFPVSKPERNQKEKPQSVYFKRRTEYNSKVEAGINRNTMTLCDLIFFNPPGNPMTSRAKENTVKSRNRSDSVTSLAEEQSVDAPDNEISNEMEIQKEKTTLNGEPEEDAILDTCAPQLKINADGEIIIDEESLVINRTVDTDRAENLKRSAIEVEEYGHRYSKKRTRAQDWTPNETGHFYSALSSVGTDFTMMKEMFFQKSKRSRTDLKMKFKKEERIHRNLVELALNGHSQYDLNYNEETG